MYACRFTQGLFVTCLFVIRCCSTGILHIHMYVCIYVHMYACRFTQGLFVTCLFVIRCCSTGILHIQYVFMYVCMYIRMYNYTYYTYICTHVGLPKVCLLPVCLIFIHAVPVYCTYICMYVSMYICLHVGLRKVCLLPVFCN